MCWQRVPDGCSCKAETLSAELNLGPCNEHVMLLSQTDVRPTRDVSDWHADMVEVGQASAADRIKASDSHLSSIQ